MTSREYVTNAIQNLEDTLAHDRDQLLKIFGKKSVERPFTSNCRPELDVSPVSDDTLMSRYLQLIGVLRWEIALGRIYIMTEVTVLSQHQCQPIEGHLAAVYHMFWYIKCNLKEISGRVVFYSKIPDIDEQLFNPSDKSVWEEFYTDQKRQYLGMPPLLGESRYMSDVMCTPIMQATRRSSDLTIHKLPWG